MNNPHWPYAWMWTTFAVAGIATIAPWMFGRRRLLIAILSVSLMLGVFACYEVVLFSRLSGKNTVIHQLELVLLLPLMLAATISCGLAAFFGRASSSPS